MKSARSKLILITAVLVVVIAGAIILLTVHYRLSFIAAGAAIAAALPALYIAWATLPGAETAQSAVSAKTLEQRLGDLATSMRESARLVEQISAELDAQAATARRLKDEAETAEAVARLHKEETAAIQRILNTQLEGAARRIRGDSIKIGIEFFFAGALVTFAVTLLVHPLHLLGTCCFLSLIWTNLVAHRIAGGRGPGARRLRKLVDSLTRAN